MRVLITGICGFVGSSLAFSLKERLTGIDIVGIDNLVRPGSEGNRRHLVAKGIQFFHGDLRIRSDVDALPSCDWVIDAAANPSVLGGIDGRSTPRQLCEHNLGGTLNIVEFCLQHKAGLILLSSSRVYSVKDLASLPMRIEHNAFHLDTTKPLIPGVSAGGLSESFSVRQPISLYGATKLSSEIIAIEHGAAFNFPVWINRCGVLAGAGQFGTAEQGIFSYWLHAHSARLPLKYIGFGGNGYQLRDAFHPGDLADLIALQIHRDPPGDTIYNAGGGIANAMSLAQLTEWCDHRFGSHNPQPDNRPRPFDIPWVVMNNDRVTQDLKWAPKRSLSSILDEIADHVHNNPAWLARSGAV